MRRRSAHLAYCTNIHPAESWAETFDALQTHTLEVRDAVCPAGEAFAIGLRLSAQAADDLLADEAAELARFKCWLAEENCYVFTINGFPYDDFHGVRVKENVYRPDWTTRERLDYTNKLFIILTDLGAPHGCGGSVSTLPGSFKAFGADENLIFANLYACSRFIEQMSVEHDRDFHLGLEPEPLGHFENAQETKEFFTRFHAWCAAKELATDHLARRIGVNYDTCHFALEYDDCRTSLQGFAEAGIRISKLHLSNALAIDPRDSDAMERLHDFDEPTYLHQVLLREESGEITRYPDIPEYLAARSAGNAPTAPEARVHFHIPLYADPAAPLGSTRDHAAAALQYLAEHPDCCDHLEIETYTWAVLPDDLQQPITAMIADEYRWVQAQQST